MQNVRLSNNYSTTYVLRDEKLNCVEVKCTNDIELNGKAFYWTYKLCDVTIDYKYE